MASASFKARFRGVDVLLVDDVQFLERKARSEEEFFHTFNALYDAGSSAGDHLRPSSRRPRRSKTACASASQPASSPTSIAPTSTPDWRSCASASHHDGIDPVDPLVLDTLARRVTLNIRALEGALIRVVAFSSLTGRPLDPRPGHRGARRTPPHHSAAPRTLAEIKAAACRHFGLTRDELLSPSRGARVTWPRQVAMYLSRELTEHSLPAIGRDFGGRDHTTVLHAWRRTAARIGTDSTSRRAVDNLREQLERAPS